MEALEWWRQLTRLEQLEIVWRYSDEKDFVYVSKSSLQIQKLYIQATAYKTDAIAQNKWSIENREQLREQRNQELKELMEKDKQDHIGDTNNMVGGVDWLEQQFLKLESTVGVQGVFYELLEQAKAIERQCIETAYDDAVQDMRQDEERPFKGFEYYNNNYEKKKQGRNFDTDAHETFQGG